MSRYYRKRTSPLEALIGMFLWCFLLNVFFAAPVFFITTGLIIYFSSTFTRNKKTSRSVNRTNNYRSKKSTYKKSRSNNFSDQPRRSVGENRLYQIVKEKYPSQKILRNERPDWLSSELGNNLELDVFLPEKNLAFEFHGRQHREYVPFLQKTVENFYRQQKNDELKRKKCKLRGVTLIEIWFDDPLTKKFVNQKINEALELSSYKTIVTTEKNVIPLFNNEVIKHSSIPTNVSEPGAKLPCLTCGFSVCQPEYHYGA